MPKNEVKIRLVLTPVDQDQTCFKTLQKLDERRFGCTAPPIKYRPQVQYWWLAYLNDEPVGFGGIELKGHVAAYICRTGVIKKARNLGIHKKLIRAIQKYARKIDIEKITTDVAHWNVISANNFIKTGFVLFRPRKLWSFKNSLYFIQRISR